jgi:hypothetical protein
MISQSLWDQVAQQKIQSRPDYSSTAAWGQAPVQDIFSKINAGQYDGAGGDGPSTNQVYSSGGYQAIPWMGGHAVYKALDPSIAGDGANQLNGTPFDIYDAQGKFLGSNKFDSISSMSAGKQFGIGAAMLAAPFALTAMGVAGAGGAAAGGAGAGSGLTGGGFVGEGAMSGIGGWDAAMAGATPWTGAAGAGTGALSGGGFVGEGAASGIPAWDGAMGAVGGGSAASGGGLSSLFGGGSGSGGLSSMLGGNSNLLGLGATALGALAGGQGQDQSTSSTRAMDPRMDQLFYGDLAQRVQGLLGSDSPQAKAVAQQLLAAGGGLLGQTAPTTATNPYLKGIADDLQKRTSDMLGQNNLDIRGRTIATGGLGGSRQGVAEGVAAGRAADFLQGNLANLYGQAYNQDMNRVLQQQTLGAGMLGQGLNASWAPARNAADVYAPFTGFGTTTNNAQSGGGWQGMLGGALTGASMGRSLGWW